MAINKDKNEYYCRFCRSWFLRTDQDVKSHYRLHVSFLEHLILDIDNNLSLEENKDVSAL